jgi:hypothetical protein
MGASDTTFGQKKSMMPRLRQGNARSAVYYSSQNMGRNIVDSVLRSVALSIPEEWRSIGVESAPAWMWSLLLIPLRYSNAMAGNV